jgi:hypothetical protein
MSLIWMFSLFKNDVHHYAYCAIEQSPFVFNVHLCDFEVRPNTFVIQSSATWAFFTLCISLYTRLFSSISLDFFSSMAKICTWICPDSLRIQTWCNNDGSRTLPWDSFQINMSLVSLAWKYSWIMMEKSFTALTFSVTLLRETGGSPAIFLLLFNSFSISCQWYSAQDKVTNKNGAPSPCSA